MVMLSTRLTGSSTNITVVSLRKAASTAVCAPGLENSLVTNSVGTSSSVIQRSSRRSARASKRRSKKTPA